MPVIHQHDNDSDAVKIAHDKEKTKRFTLYIVSLVLVAVFGIYFVFRASDNGGTRKFDLDLKGGKIALSVDKPIVAQIGVATTSYQTSKGEIQYTTGRVSPDLIRQLQGENMAFSDNAFTGKNFINQRAGFVFSIDHPQNWQISNSQGRRLENAEIVNSFNAADGSNMNVVIEELPSPMDFNQYVDLNVQGLFSQGLVTERPPIGMDPSSNTAIFYYNNIVSGGATFQKLILSGNRSYVATANFSPLASNPQIIEDMRQMLASFTLISN